MKVWQCPSEGCETICGRRDRLTRHLKSLHNLNISRSPFDALCISHDVLKGHGTSVQGTRDRGRTSKGARAGLNSSRTSQRSPPASSNPAPPKKKPRKRSLKSPSRAGPSQRIEKPGNNPRVIDLCTPSPSSAPLPLPAESNPAYFPSGSARTGSARYPYAAALSPDSTPPPLDRIQPNHHVEVSNIEGIPRVSDGPSSFPAGRSDTANWSIDEIRCTKQHENAQDRRGGPGGANTRPRAEVRNPADWVRADEVSPTSTPEPGVLPAVDQSLSSARLSSSTLSQQPSNHGYGPAGKRARPTWVVRTPTPPLAIRLPPTPPITPEHGDLKSSTAVSQRTRNLLPPSGTAATNDACEGHSELEADADDELSDYDELDDVAEAVDMADPEEDEVMSVEEGSGDGADERREGQEETRFHGGELVSAGGASDEELEDGSGTVAGCPNQEDDPIVEEVAAGDDCRSTEAEADSYTRSGTEETEDQEEDSEDTPAVHAGPDPADDLTDTTSDAENDVEELIGEIADSDTSDLKPELKERYSLSPDSSSIARAMTEEAGMEWEESAYGHRLPA